MVPDFSADPAQMHMYSSQSSASTHEHTHSHWRMTSHLHESLWGDGRKTTDKWGNKCWCQQFRVMLNSQKCFGRWRIKRVWQRYWQLRKAFYICKACFSFVFTCMFLCLLRPCLFRSHNYVVTCRCTVHEQHISDIQTINIKKKDSIFDCCFVSKRTADCTHNIILHIWPWKHTKSILHIHILIYIDMTWSIYSHLALRMCWLVHFNRSKCCSWRVEVSTKKEINNIKWQQKVDNSEF